MIAIAGLGLAAGFLALSLYMPPAAPQAALETPQQQAYATSAAPVAASAEPSPSTLPASPSAKPSGEPDLHDPNTWQTAPKPVAQATSDTDVEFEDLGSPSPSHSPPGNGKKPPATQSPDTGELDVDKSRARPLEAWKKGITAYSRRHYGEATWELKPTCIVLHYTAGAEFPWNLVSSRSFDGEAPGLASHYVIDGTHIWQLLPPDVRSRAAYGINHRAINIEMVARDGPDLARRKQTLESCISLVRWLMATYDIPKSKIYSHTAVSHMSKREVPEVLDLVDARPYGKSDPGEQNMRTIKGQL